MKKGSLIKLPEDNDSYGVLLETFQDFPGYGIAHKIYNTISQKIEYWDGKFQDKVDWFYISYYQKLSESFIEKFQNKVDWNCISSSQKLSEPFIEKFQDKVYWRYISYRQTLSPSFQEKWNHKLK